MFFHICFCCLQQLKPEHQRNSNLEQVFVNDLDHTHIGSYPCDKVNTLPNPCTCSFQGEDRSIPCHDFPGILCHSRTALNSDVNISHFQEELLHLVRISSSYEVLGAKFLSEKLNGEVFLHRCSATGKADVRFKWSPTAKTGDCLHNVPFQVVFVPRSLPARKAFGSRDTSKFLQKNKANAWLPWTNVSMFYIRQIIFKQSYFSGTAIGALFLSQSFSPTIGAPICQLAKVGVFIILWHLWPAS